MAKWIDVGPASDFPKGERRCVESDAAPLIVFNVKGKLLAIANNCPHANLPLTEGELRGKVLTCPYHGFTYNIETGADVDDPQGMPVATFETRVTDAGRLEVALPQ